MTDELEDNFLTKQKFSKLVEQTVRQLNISYMETIIHLSEEHKIELDDMKRYLSPVIKDKLEAEARNLNYLPRENTLPFME